MSKTFTCRELGGTCDERFSGETLEEIMQKGMTHMGTDEAHMARIQNLSNETGESKEAWFARMQKAFNERKED